MYWTAKIKASGQLTFSQSGPVVGAADTYASFVVTIGTGTVLALVGEHTVQPGTFIPFPEGVYPISWQQNKGESITVIYEVYAHAYAGAGTGSWATAEAKFNNTFEWLGVVSVTDGQGNPVLDYTLVDENGVDWTTPAAEDWAGLGYGLAGSSGIPSLVGDGDVAQGAPCSLELSSARSSSLSMLFVSIDNAATAFKGGILITVPPLLSLPFVTGVDGSVVLPFTWPSGAPAGLVLYYQWAIVDDAAVQGVSLSNGLSSTSN